MTPAMQIAIVVELLLVAGIGVMCHMAISQMRDAQLCQRREDVLWAESRNQQRIYREALAEVSAIRIAVRQRIAAERSQMRMAA